MRPGASAYAAARVARYDRPSAHASDAVDALTAPCLGRGCADARRRGMDAVTSEPEMAKPPPTNSGTPRLSEQKAPVLPAGLFHIRSFWNLFGSPRHADCIVTCTGE